MVEPLKSWFKENQTLLIFLAAQAVALGVGGAGLISYYVKMETRVHTMETRGAAYTVERMSRIENRLTILEQQLQKNDEITKRNEESLRRVIDVMTRELGKTIPQPPYRLQSDDHK